MGRNKDSNKKAGLIWLRVDGVLMSAKGEFTVTPGYPKREALVGAADIHGYKETPQVPSIEGAVTDSQDLDVEALCNATNVTGTLELNNDKTWVIEDAWYAGDGSLKTGEGEISFRLESRHILKEMK